MLAPATAATLPDGSTAERYESLIRIANSIRARKEPRELFGLLVQELSRVIQFDAIAQFDEASNKIDWHLGGGCRKPAQGRSEEHTSELQSPYGISYAGFCFEQERNSRRDRGASPPRSPWCRRHGGRRV